MIVEREITLSQLIDALGMDYSTPEQYDISGYGLEVESYNSATDITEFRKVTDVLVKNEVPYHYMLGELKGSANHRVLVGNEYISLKDHPNAVRIEVPLPIVDISVEGTQNYIANGVVNHNTTSGGK